MGIPTAPISTKAFLSLAKTITFKKGMPLQRQTFTPHPTAGRSPAVVRGYLEGNDPVTGKPILDEIVGALTRPLTPEERKTGFISRPRPRTLDPNTADNLQRYLQDQGFTDGLPVVLPTEERVRAMLKGTSHKPDEVVGIMRPSPPYEAWEYTVEMVATNAVMAGASPDMFPTILALASTGVTTLFSSTTSFARMAVVNGPVRQELNMNSGIGALGPFNEANAVIGRAWTLVSKNLSGAIPGETYMGSQGNAINHLNNLVPENEEDLPKGWQSFAVRKGFKPTESVVSVFTGWNLINQNGSLARDVPGIGRELDKVRGMGTGRAFFMLDPIVASDLAATHSTAEQFAEWIAGSQPPIVYSGSTSDGLPHPWTIETITVGGGTNPCFHIGDLSYVASASIDKWK